MGYVVYDFDKTLKSWHWLEAIFTCIVLIYTSGNYPKKVYKTTKWKQCKFVTKEAPFVKLTFDVRLHNYAQWLSTSV